MTWITKVTELNLKAWCDFKGQLEVTLASDANNMAVRANMQMDFRVIKVADYKSDTKVALRCYWGCLDGTIASEAIKLADRGNMQTNVGAIKVSDSKYEVKLNHDIINYHSLRVYRALPSCCISLSSKFGQ